MISLEKKFVFVHIPKTGGNAVRLVLEPYAVDEVVFNAKQEAYNTQQQQVHRFGIKNPFIKISKHSSLLDIQKQWLTDQFGDWDSFLKFAVVRNPWDRLVSFYFSPHLGRTEFDRVEFNEFLTSGNVKTQLSFLVDEKKQFLTNQLLRFESLREDLASLCVQLDMPCELQRINQSQHKPYQEYYDEESMALVAHHFAEDVESLGYDFSP